MYGPYKVMLWEATATNTRTGKADAATSGVKACGQAGSVSSVRLRQLSNTSMDMSCHCVGFWSYCVYQSQARNWLNTVLHMLMSHRQACQHADRQTYQQLTLVGNDVL